MKFLAPIFAFALGNFCQLWAQETAPQTVRVPVARDAVLYGEDILDGVDRANGAGESLVVGSVQSGIFRRTLISFDLDGYVPAGAVVTDAKLTLNLLSGTTSPVLFIFRVQGGWASGVTDPENELFGDLAQTGDPTANFRVFNETNLERRIAWMQPGGDFVIDRPLFAELGTVEENVVTFSNETLTADVQAMVSLPEQHFGWVLLGDEGSFISGFLQFASGENEDEALRPVLEITFTEASDFERVVTNYASLVTVAGRGEDRETKNFWNARYEGGDALSAELSRPAAAVGAKDGTIYFADTFAHAVRKVTTDGTIVTVAGTGVRGYNVDEGPALDVQLDLPNGLFVMPNGNVYILDLNNKRVRKVTPEGQLTTVFHDETAPEFLTGRGLWVSEDESTIVYSSQTVMKRWTAVDDKINILAAGFDCVSQFGQDVLTGDFICADDDDHKVFRVSSEDGTKTHIAGGGQSLASGMAALDLRLDGARGLAVTRHGGYFVTTQNGGDVWYIDINGVGYLFLQGVGNGNLIEGEGQVLRDLIGAPGDVLSQPFSVSIAPNGDLILVTNESGLIRVVLKGRTPELTSSGLGSGVFNLTWASQPQRLYLVEGSEDAQNWEVLGEVPSSSNEASFSDLLSEDRSNRLYRVRLFYP